MWFLKVRQCCCALHTFVRIVSILLLLLHLVVAVAAIVWYALMDSVNFGADKDNSIPRSRDRSIDERTDGHTARKLLHT